jgi:DNA-binding IclR family transcriptional regulator
MITIAEPIDADTLRIRHEFLTQPDLCVSADVFAELLGLPMRHAQIMLESLVFERFLARTPDGRYKRYFSGRNR